MEKIELPPFTEEARLTETLNNFDLIVEFLKAEREEQNQKWGQQTHSPGKWLVILGEEYGEVCQAALDGEAGQLACELVQVAAVARDSGSNCGRRRSLSASPTPGGSSPTTPGLSTSSPRRSAGGGRPF